LLQNGLSILITVFDRVLILQVSLAHRVAVISLLTLLLAPPQFTHPVTKPEHLNDLRTGEHKKADDTLALAHNENCRWQFCFV